MFYEHPNTLRERNREWLDRYDRLVTWWQEFFIFIFERDG